MSDLPLALTFDNAVYYSHLVSPRFVNLVELSQKGVTIPSGFLLTTAAHQLFVQSNHLDKKINDLKQTHDLTNPQELMSFTNQLLNYGEGSSHDPLLTQLLQLNLSILHQNGLTDFQTHKLLIRDSRGSNQVIDYNLASILDFVKRSYLDVYRPLNLNFEPSISFLIQSIPPTSFQGSITTHGTPENPHLLNLALNDQSYFFKYDANYLEGELTTILNSVQINRLLDLVTKIKIHYYLPQELYFFICGNDVYFLDSQEITPQPQVSDFAMGQNISQPLAKITDLPNYTPLSKSGDSRIVKGKMRFVNNFNDLSRIQSHEIAIVRNLRYLTEILLSTKPRAIVFVGKIDPYFRLKLKSKRIPFVILDNLPLHRKYHRYCALLNTVHNSLSF